MARERGPFDHSFEQGHVPMDEPPGIEEREYKAWKDAGGVVLRDVPAELAQCREELEDFLHYHTSGIPQQKDTQAVLAALIRVVLGK